MQLAQNLPENLLVLSFICILEYLFIFLLIYFVFFLLFFSCLREW